MALPIDITGDQKYCTKMESIGMKYAVEGDCDDFKVKS